MANQRLNATITIGGVLKKSVTKQFGLIRSGFESIGDSIKDVKKRQKELSRERADLIKQGRSVEALDREYEDLERTLEDLVRKQRRWERAMRDSRRVGESFGKMSRNIGRLGRQVGAGLAAAGAGVFALASSTASYGDQVAKTAGKLGIGIEALQEFRYAAERSGVSTETFDSSLTAMQKRLGEAAQGTGAAKKALDQIGLSAKDLMAVGPDRAMGQIADKLKGIENPAERAAIAAALFSRSGIGMVNMLGGGSEALQQLREDARKTGYVLSEQAARDAEAFADAQLDAQLTVKGLKNTIGAELMPVVTRSMKSFSAWAVSNREGVAKFADTAARKLEAALPVIGQVVEGMGKVSTTIGGVISKVAAMVGGWENFGMVVGALFAARTIGSVLSFGFAVGRLGVSLAALVPWASAAGGAMGMLSGGLALVKTGVVAVGRALLMNPIGLAVAAIAGSAYLIYKHWDKVGPWFGKLWGNVKQTFKGIGGFVSGVWRGDWDAAADGLATAWQGAKGYLSTILEGIGGVFRFAWENGIRPITDKLGITEHITGAWQTVGPYFKRHWDGVTETFKGFGAFIGGVWRGDMAAAAAGLGRAWDGAKAILGNVFDGIGGVFRFAWEKVIKPVTDKLGVTETITAAWQSAQTAVGKVVTGIGTALRKGYDGTIGPVIEALGATGGISAAWEAVKTSIGAVIDWLGEKFDWLMGKLQPVLDGLSWLRDKGAGAVESIQGIGSGLRSWWNGEEQGQPGGSPAAPGSTPEQTKAPRNPRTGKAVPKRISGSYLGGIIGRGFREVGEQGPETIWTSKGGYVAHANATERLARLSDRAAPLLDALGGGLRNAMAKAESAAAPVVQQVQLAAERMAPAAMPAQAPAPQPAPVVIHAQINAQHLSAAQIADELERRGRAAQAGALYDQAHDYGQYGGG
ncbi:phage tail tape measure protein [Leisingera sp. ANG59]|uniref:phage tail tape measure protein n=1 Tax=Leisingera sp. ANG59 TaxID=2675221 RepID=UPI0020C6C128|nr:phage tail tape measure protein [Leisingera sp. ANG59]